MVAMERRRWFHWFPDRSELVRDKAFIKEPDDHGPLRKALADLPLRQMEVLHLVFYQGLTILEASRAMGVTEGTARTHYERGKARLKKRLEQEDER